jgi:hypothetical protein
MFAFEYWADPVVWKRHVGVLPPNVSVMAAKRVTTRDAKTADEALAKCRSDLESKMSDGTAHN